RAERHTHDRVVVALDGQLLLARGRIPDAQASVPPADQALAVRTEVNAVQPFATFAESEQPLPRLGVPQLDFTRVEVVLPVVAATGTGDARTIEAVRHILDRGGMSRQGEKLLARFR